MDSGKINLRDIRVLLGVLHRYLFRILRSRLATLQLRVGESRVYRLATSPTPDFSVPEAQGSPGAKKGENSSLGERNFRISVAATELPHRYEILLSFPFFHLTSNTAHK